ncbi:hypothetical protein [Sphingomonas sp.]|jgi:hypothetical protein|uniref:hypothetical protein n=1 Tax=Sphingomonas sp. TaxID=28214 RepID=UPI002630C70A|nr:hypothetical protein [Sphingomonas sp.]MDF2493276.1 hypothetical protein [Sphingomonas sp.]
MDHDPAAVRSAALDLIIYADLTAKEGSFCGQIAFDTKPLSDRQERWLRILLDRHNLAPLNHSSRSTGARA